MANHTPFQASHSRTACLLVGIAWLGVFAAPTCALAQIYTYSWTVAGANSDVSTGTNWQGNSAPVNNSGANVLFTDAYFQTGKPNILTPNISANYYINSLAFGGASSFTLGSTTGNGFDIGSGIAQNSVAAQTISVPTYLTDDQTWTFASGAGALNFTYTGSSQIKLQNYTLTLSAQGNNTLSGSISGTGAVVVGGAGTLKLAGASTYTGGTTIGNGATLTVGTGGSLTSGATSASAAGLSVGAGGTLNVSGTGSVNPGTSNVLSLAGTSASPANLNLSGPAGTATSSLSVYEAQISGAAVTQTGGTFTVNNLFELGYAAGASSTYNLSGDTLTTTNSASIGVGSSATFTQTGGSFSPGTLSICVATGKGVVGTYKLSGTGSLSTGTFIVGFVSEGHVTQGGGSVTTNGSSFFVGDGAGIYGTYTLNSGSLSTGAATIGNDGPANFTQNGGTFTTNGATLIVGNDAVTGTTYVVHDPNRLPVAEDFVRAYGARLFQRNGGERFTGVQPNTPSTGGSGGIILNTGSVSTGTVYVGYSGEGSITQYGGTFNTGGNLLYLGYKNGSVGEYSLNGGTLTTGGVAGGSSVGGSTFDFYGGTLQAGAASTTFFHDVTSAYVRAGGAKIDTNGFDITIA